MSSTLNVRGQGRGTAGKAGTGAWPGRAAGRRAWVPRLAWLVCLLTGLADVLAVFPDWHEKLYRINALLPGTVTDVTRSAGVITGLLLILLSGGLRRAPLDPRAGNAVTSTWRECRHDHLDKAPLNQLGQGNDVQRPESSIPAPHRPRHPDRQCD